jgi:hypothetical protein
MRCEDGLLLPVGYLTLESGWREVSEESIKRRDVLSPVAASTEIRQPELFLSSIYGRQYAKS